MALTNVIRKKKIMAYPTYNKKKERINGFITSRLGIVFENTLSKERYKEG
jgi:hypothetical protein